MTTILERLEAYLKEDNTPVVTSNELMSGFLKDKKTIIKVNDFYNAKVNVKLSNGKVYKFKRRVTGTGLVKGMLLACSYNSTNQGVTFDEFLGITDDKSEYAEKPKTIFNSIKECLQTYKVSTLKGLEELQNKNKYGFQSYLICKDLESGEQGPWYYLFKGRWSRGSGAEALSFAEIEEVK